MNKQEELNKLKEQVKKLESEIEQEKNKRDYIYLPKFKCWILPKVILKNKTFEQQKAEIPKGCEIASYEIIQYCRNNKLHKCFEEFWVNVPNPDEISKNNNHIAKFYADSDWANLNCDWDPSLTNSYLGVFVVTRNSQKQSNTNRRGKV